MLILPGSNALSAFRSQRLLTQLQAVAPAIVGIQARFYHFIDASHALSDQDKTMLEANSQKTGQSVEALANARRQGIPAKRFGTPQEFGAICAFLCSVHAGYITGQNVLADGGAYPGTF